MATKNVTVLVEADQDQDNCLEAALESYLEEHPELAEYDLAPRWADASREMVALTVPAWATEG